MTEETQGAAEWLRVIAREEYDDDGDSACVEIHRRLGVECFDVGRCRECAARSLENIADRIDADRELPEGVEWPRFEDGELVKVGDEVECEGDVMDVVGLFFEYGKWRIHVGNSGTFGFLHGKHGERVKRPTPKVLDADGAPINVGDTVYLRSNGRKGEVVGFYEDKGETWVGETWVSVSYELGSDRMTVNTEGKALTHERPDSWERIEEDAYHLVMSEYLETPEKDVRDIVRRAKALAKAGE